MVMVELDCASELLDMMTEAVITLDRDLRFRYVNPAAERVFGLPKSELLGRTLWEAFPLVRGAEIEAVLRKALGGERSIRRVEYYEPQQRWFEASAFPCGDGIAVHFRDITERRRAQTILSGQKHAFELAMNGAPLHAILEQLVRAVEAQGAGRMVAAIHLVEDGKLYHGAAPNLPDAYNEAISGLPIGPNVGSCGTAAFTGESVIVRDVQTDPRWAAYREIAAQYDLRACWSMPLRASTGEVIGTFAQYNRQVWDPTPQDLESIEVLGRTAAMVIERERDARRRESSAIELERANRAKDQFLAMLGHELRNPLAPIVIALHLMEIRGEQNTRSARSVIARQVEQLTRLVDDLLDVARFSSGHITLRRSVIDLADVVTHAIEMTRPLFQQRRHNLSISLDENLYVEGDATRLAQVFANVMTNAAKFSERGSRTTLSAVRTGDMVSVSIRDQGIGIDPAVLPTVFDLFTQAEQAIDRAQGGLGLGLAIVKNLVVHHGGRVSAHSEGAGRGSTFTIELPASALPLTQAMPEPVRLIASTTSRRILIVDDNPDICGMMKETLSLLGHEVRVEHDGQSALEAVEELAPEVVLLDIGLPVMDGHEVARRLRKRPGAGPMIIAVTGYGQDADRERALAAGCDAHLVKPIALDALLRMIDDLPS
jgi:PAS domain S-box-containing protein